MEYHIEITLNEVIYFFVYFAISTFLSFLFLKANLFFKVLVFIVLARFWQIVIDLNSWPIAIASVLGVLVIFGGHLKNVLLSAYDMTSDFSYWVSDKLGGFGRLFLRFFRNIYIYGINFFVLLYNLVCTTFRINRRFLYWGDEFERFNNFEPVTEKKTGGYSSRGNRSRRSDKRDKSSSGRSHRKKSNSSWREKNRKREEELRQAQDQAKQARQEANQAKSQAEREKEKLKEELKRAREETRRQAEEEEQANQSSPPPTDNRSFQEILGLQPSGFSKAELKQAYRRASSQYHPDKHAHMPQAFQDQASEEFKKIQRAYKALQSVAV